MWLKEEEENPPVPQFEPRVRKLFMLDNYIQYCQPAVILRNVLITVLEVTTHYLSMFPLCGE